MIISSTARAISVPAGVKPGERVLEIGYGPGFYTEEISRAAENERKGPSHHLKNFKENRQEYRDIPISKLRR